MPKRNRGGKGVRWRFRRIGVTVQICLYIFNGIVWLLAFFATGFGIVIGLSTNTIGVGSDFEFLDLFITTPATIFLMYGALLLALAFLGCFAAVSANRCINIVYCILIFIYIAFDILIGIRLFFFPNAYNRYMERVNKSLNGYGDADAKYIGVWPIHPTTYWDHFQRKGRCCGLYDYHDWKPTKIGVEKFSMPDSCCNQEYDYEGCGFLLWKHPDHAYHTLLSIINERSCLSVFPKAVRGDDSRMIDWMGKFLFAFLLLCMILSIVLICLVSRKRFWPALGLTNPSFLDAPENPALLEERCGRRVCPAPGGGDACGKQKRLRFNDGPCIINRREEYEDDEC